MCIDFVRRRKQQLNQHKPLDLYCVANENVLVPPLQWTVFKTVHVGSKRLIGKYSLFLSKEGVGPDRVDLAKNKKSYKTE